MPEPPIPEPAQRRWRYHCTPKLTDGEGHPMGEMTTLMARDGHEFQAWLCAPKGEPRGAVVVLQEIFGLNQHIRAVADGYAEAGFLTIAPAMFDRVRRGIELGYSAPEIQQGVGYMLQVTRPQALATMAACVAVVKHAGRVGAVGYCWGGRCAYWAACELPIAAASSYYGGGIANDLDKTPKAPTIFHFGERDTHIPLTDIEKIRAAYPTGKYYFYPAGHGFNCTERADYDASSAQLARQRTVDFFSERLTSKQS